MTLPDLCACCMKSRQRLTNDIQGFALQQCCHIHGGVPPGRVQNVHDPPKDGHNMSKTLPASQSSRRNVALHTHGYACALRATHVLPDLMLLELKAGMTPFLTFLHWALPVLAVTML